MSTQNEIEELKKRVSYIRNIGASKEAHEKVIELVKEFNLPISYYFNYETGDPLWSVYIETTDYWLASFGTEEEAQKYIENLQSQGEKK